MRLRTTPDSAVTVRAGREEPGIGTDQSGPVSNLLYAERLHVPVRWWITGGLYLLTVWIAVILWVPALLAWAVTAVVVLLFALGMISYGGARVIVTRDDFRAGSAHIRREFVAGAVALSVEESWKQAFESSVNA
jgi:hypothetical protein